MNHFLEKSDSYFQNSGAEIIAHDWKQLRLMTLLYLGALILYFLTVCLYEGISAQTRAVACFILIQLAYSLYVRVQTHAPESQRAMSRYLWVFGTNIMGLSILLGDFISRDNTAWLFPIMLILMTQIYSLPPREMFAALPLYTAFFLTFSFLNKSRPLFFTDLIASLAALAVAMLAYVAILCYKIEVAETKTELIRMCSVDAMTGMFNKSTFVHLYGDYIRSAPAAASYALAVIDIDRFKSINDTHGHLVGDDVLRAFASIFNEYFSDTERGIPGRFGGDEFVLLLKSVTGEDEIRKLRDILMERLRARTAEKLGFEITCSVGVAIAARPGIPFSRLFLTADQELYRVKKLGGDTLGITREEALQKRQTLLLTVDVSPSDIQAIREAFGASLWILETCGTIDAIRALERYGENLALLMIDLDADQAVSDSILPEITKLTQIRRFPVILLSRSVPPAWKKLTSEILASPLPAAAVTDAVARHLPPQFAAP